MNITRIYEWTKTSFENNHHGFFYFHFQFFKHVAESAKIENLSKNKHKNTHTQVRAHVFLDSAQVEFNTKVKRK